MAVNAWDFPITGDRVVEALRENFSTNDIWLLSHFDAPSGAKSKVTLDHLRERMVNRPLEVSTGDLCGALAGAASLGAGHPAIIRPRSSALYRRW